MLTQGAKSRIQKNSNDYAINHTLPDHDTQNFLLPCHSPLAAAVRLARPPPSVTPARQSLVSPDCAMSQGAGEEPGVFAITGDAVPPRVVYPSDTPVRAAAGRRSEVTDRFL